MFDTLLRGHPLSKRGFAGLLAKVAGAESRKGGWATYKISKDFKVVARTDYVVGAMHFQLLSGNASTGFACELPYWLGVIANNR